VRERLALGLVAGLTLAALACADTPSPTSATTPPPALPTPSRRVLVVTHTTGFRHPSITTAESVISRIGVESGLFSTLFCRDQADVSRLLTPAALASIDAVLFANTTGDLGVADLPAVLSWIADGHAFVGVHSASDTYHESAAYLEMLGAEFETHGAESSVDIRVEDMMHPAGMGLPSPLRVFDEIYEFRTNPRPRVNVLFSLDRHPNDGHQEAGQPGDFPLAWSRAYGRGRVFYTALGHRDEVWNDRRFQQHLLGALSWAMNEPSR
jgi:type 1 glutamine amidotransferase